MPRMLFSSASPGGISRRRFLQASGGALAGLSLACQADPAPVPDTGLLFEGSTAQVQAVVLDFERLWAAFHLPRALLCQHVSATSVNYTLAPAACGAGTLDLRHRSSLWLQDDEGVFPAQGGGFRRRVVVSRKEILLALLHPGRLTEFRGAACGLSALQDHIGVRQAIAAAASDVNFDWPDGGQAHWNERYWNRGTPHAHVSLVAAYRDAIAHSDRYGVGCYTAAKLVMSQGVLDYYARVNRQDDKLQAVEAAMSSARRDPLVGVEPPGVWYFEDDFDPATRHLPGTLLTEIPFAATQHFVPGDWCYFLNTDPVSYQKTGYEGSNAIYLGDGKFSDYYNDNAHTYTFEQKLAEVYQWRHGVFSHSRDFEKAGPLSAEQELALATPPEAGGVLLPWRLVPRYFGYED